MYTLYINSILIILLEKKIAVSDKTQWTNVFTSEALYVHQIYQQALILFRYFENKVKKIILKLILILEMSKYKKLFQFCLGVVESNVNDKKK